MGNQLQGSVQVYVPQYVADGLSGSGNDRSLTFSGGAPPTDGSIAMCTVIIQSSLGISYANGAYQRLFYWADTNPGKAEVIGGSGFNTVSVPTFSCVQDAS